MEWLGFSPAVEREAAKVRAGWDELTRRHRLGCHDSHMFRNGVRKERETYHTFRRRLFSPQFVQAAEHGTTKDSW